MRVGGDMSREDPVWPFSRVNLMLWGIAPSHPHNHATAESEQEAFMQDWSAAVAQMDPAPEESCSFFGNHFLTWLDPYIYLAAAEKFEEKDFPPPCRAHRAQMSGSRVSEAFRRGEMRDGRHAWLQHIESVQCTGAADPGGGEEGGSMTVAMNPRCVVAFAGGAGSGAVRGRLRWVGYLSACDEPNRLLAGVEWTDGAIPPYRAAMDVDGWRGDPQVPAFGSGGGGTRVWTASTGVHRGFVHGERLFYQADAAAPARCTLEFVEDIELACEERADAAGSSASPALRPRAPSLMWTLLRTFKADVMSLFFVAMATTVCSTVSPLLLQQFVVFLENDKSSGGGMQRGLLILFGFGAVKLLEPVANCKYYQRMDRVASHFRSSVLALIFEKCVTVSTNSLADPNMNPGRILTMASTDVENIRELPRNLMYFWMGPLELSFYIVYLFYLVGWSAFASIFVFLAALPVEAIAARYEAKFRSQLASCTDKRLRKTSELLSGIRMVKAMGWEQEFLRSIEEESRTEELRNRRLLQMCHMIIQSTLSGVPLLMIGSVLVCFTATGHKVTPQIIFPVVAIFRIVEWPITMLPMSISACVRFYVSCRRVNRFLECDDVRTTTRDIAELFGDAEAAREPGESPHPVAKEAPSTDRGLQAILLKGVSVLASVAVQLPLCASVRTRGLLYKVQHVLCPGRLPREPVELQCAECAPEEDGAVASVTVDVSSEVSREGGGTTKAGRTIVVPKALLEGVDLSIPSGKLTVIVGATGSGKSVLLSAILGAFSLSHASEVDGSGGLWASRSIAYVPQQSWIMQDTVRANIVFFEGDHKHTEKSDERGAACRSPLRHGPRGGGRRCSSARVAMDARLARAVRSCQLETDLKELSDGLETEIGEKGVNLSGGQKARVSLARAVYADRDVYLMDDPLSALDAHVGKRIITDVVLGELSEKTRVLVTHHLDVLPQADHIAVLHGGRVVFAGDYAAYMNTEWQASITAAISEEKVPTPPAELDDCASPVGASAPGPFPCGGGDGDGGNEQYSSSEDDEGSEVDMAILPEKEGGAMGAPPLLPPTSGDGAGKLIVEEEKEAGQVPWSVYKRYMKAGGGYLKATLVIVASLTGELIITASEVWLSAWGGHLFSRLTDWQYLGIYILLVMLSLVSIAFRIIVRNHFMREAGRHLHASILFFITSATSTFFDRTPLGRIVNRFAKDVLVLDEELVENFSSMLDLFAFPLLAIGIAIVSMPPAAVVVAVAAVAFYKMLCYFARVIREVRRRSSIASSPMFTLLEEILGGRATIDAYKKTSVLFSVAMRRLDKLYSCAYTERVVNTWLNVRVQYIGCCILLSVIAIGVTEKLISDHSRISPSRVALISLSITMCMDLFWSLPMLILLAARCEACMNSTQRVLSYVDNVDHEELGLETVCGGPVAAGDIAVQRGDDGDAPASPSSRSSAPGALVFKRVDFRYREGLPLVLRSLSFTIRPREKIGVVGRTGSGKSTLLLALMRFVDICGGDMIVSGAPLRLYTVPELRRRLALVPQDPVLFEGTVRSNLDPFRDSSDVEVMEALRMVGLDARDDGVAPLTLGTLVQDGGMNFSVGQRQLLCVARALLKKGSEFILMDEATANIDPALDVRLQEVTQRCFARYTVITIAHRLHTVANYDRVLVMRRGELVEQGSPRELVSNPESLFYHMVAQSAGGGGGGEAVSEEQNVQAVAETVAEFLSRCK